ncbi:hypothetical protein FS749_006586 [Ceratobasidium sp. UAMH 11750]|nr:hypothetical protein FS749_006586 [Ceratobasidium sp. UAMH 11750]
MAAIRDTTYYFNAQSLVLQVEDVLFRIDVSRLASHSEVFSGMLGLPSGSDGAEGTSDANPVKLPQIKAEEFRSLLYLFYQSPVDPDFLSFMSGVSDRESHSTTFKKYLDITRLARRFCMTEVEAWAQKQIIREIEACGAASTDWLKPDDLLATLSYARLCANSLGDELVRKITATLYYIVGQYSEDNLLELYRGGVPDLDPALQGFVILCILKSGHESSLWAKLTWAEKAPLYAVWVHLTPLPMTQPFISLSFPNLIDLALGEEKSGGTCMSVFQEFRPAWGNEISEDNWWSSAPLRGISETVKLPLARRCIQEVLPRSPCKCDGVDCRILLLAKLHDLMVALFVGVTNIRNKITT